MVVSALRANTCNSSRCLNSREHNSKAGRMNVPRERDSSSSNSRDRQLLLMERLVVA